MTSSLKLFKILYFIKQIDSKLPCVCSTTDHRRRQNVVRTSVTHSAAPRVPLFCSYHTLTSSVIYYWTDARQLWIYLLNIYICCDRGKEQRLYFHPYKSVSWLLRERERERERILLGSEKIWILCSKLSSSLTGYERLEQPRIINK